MSRCEGLNKKHLLWLVSTLWNELNIWIENLEQGLIIANRINLSIESSALEWAEGIIHINLKLKEPTSKILFIVKLSPEFFTIFTLQQTSILFKNHNVFKFVKVTSPIIF